MTGLTLECQLRTDLAVAEARNHLARRRGQWARMAKAIRWRRWALSPARLSCQGEGRPGLNGQLVERHDTAGHLSRKASQAWHAKREAAAR